MKQCHACGQKLPLKVGDVVEVLRLSKLRQGVVVRVIGADGTFANIQPFNGDAEFQEHRTRITRLHGYYRVTEREPLA